MTSRIRLGALPPTITSVSAIPEAVKKITRVAGVADGAVMTASQAIEDAASKGKSYFEEPSTPYSLGDLWFESGGLIRRCTTARSTGAYNAADWTLWAIKADYVSANVEMDTPVLYFTTGYSDPYDLGGGNSGTVIEFDPARIVPDTSDEYGGVPVLFITSPSSGKQGGSALEKTSIVTAGQYYDPGNYSDLNAGYLRVDTSAGSVLIGGGGHGAESDRVLTVGNDVLVIRSNGTVDSVNASGAITSGGASTLCGSVGNPTGTTSYVGAIHFYNYRLYACGASNWYKLPANMVSA
jgi:hypothetical protein